MEEQPDPWPTPDTHASPPVPAVLCANCGTTIYWRRPHRGLPAGWKHEATGFAHCGPDWGTKADPREDT